MTRLYSVKFLLFLFGVIGLANSLPNRVRENSSGNIESSEDVERLLGQLRTESIKNTILEELHLTAPPVVSASSQIPSKKVTDMLMTEKENEINSIVKVVEADRVNSSCSERNINDCIRFEFALPSHLDIEKLELRYKITENVSDALPFIIIKVSSTENSTISETKEIIANGQTGSWKQIALPYSVEDNTSDETAICVVEMNGLKTDITSDEKPFLLVTARQHSIIRTRRSTQSRCEANSSCCLVPFNVTFEDIGWNWILQPTYVQANLCVGKCVVDLSRSQNDYEYIMMMVRNINANIENERRNCNLRLPLHCTHKELGHIMIGYLDEKGYFSRKIIPNIRIESCTCV